ncbi:MAG: hypothetical protein ACOC8K_07000 [Gemmatimonadota bacterium]
MSRTKALLVPTILCVLFLSDQARGQDIASPYRYIEATHETGIFAGILSPGTGQLELGPEEGPTVGARYAIELTGPLSLEGVGRTLITERSVRDPRRAEGERVRGTADVYLTSADIRLKFSLPGRRTWNGLSPYVSAGGGVAFDLGPAPAADQELLAEHRFDFGTSFLGLLGLGVRWIPRDNLQFRVDAEFDLWQLDTPPGYLTEENVDLFETPPPEDEWVNALGVTIGAAIRW